jgi:hypothetical protein
MTGLVTNLAKKEIGLNAGNDRWAESRQMGIEAGTS